MSWISVLPGRRYLSERICEYFNYFHRVVTRYDKTALTCLSFVQVAASYVWLQNVGRTYPPRMKLYETRNGSLRRLRNGLLDYLRCRTFEPMSRWFG